MVQPIEVHIWSDVACPWCYIGKRRFDAGVEAFRSARSGGEDVDVTYRSYQLSPDMPDDFEGTAAQYLATHKGIPEAQAAAMQEHVASIAAGEGLAYDFAAQKPANTALAHEVLQFALTRGVQAEVEELLFAAHWNEGRHIGRIDELAEIVAAAGLDPAEVADVLGRRVHRSDVEADIDLARRIGVSGVPFFVFDGRYAVSGAQPADTFADVLHRVVAEQ